MSLEANEYTVFGDDADFHRVGVWDPQGSVFPSDLRVLTPGHPKQGTWLQVTTGSPGFQTQPAPVISTTSDVAVLSHATASTEPAPTDPLFELQWHFDWIGDIQKIWEEYTGAGVHVGVYDDGMQIADNDPNDGADVSHPDLIANYDPSRQVYVWGEEMVPEQTLGSAGLTGAKHGTAVSGLIAASRNGIGGVGVAYGASLTGVDILSGQKLSDINANFWGFWEAAFNSTNFDVVNHSWGNGSYFYQPLNFPDSQSLDQDTIFAWMYALDYGRIDAATGDALGTIQVKAAGNQNLNANGVSSSTSRATITVGAYDDDGDASYYSNHGSNLLISAPTSGAAGNAGQVTTDLTGVMEGSLAPYGYNGLPDLDYTNAFGGTSGAAPIVTGVIALMMEANAHLGWRDVQNILAYSAREIGSGVGGTRTRDEAHIWGYNGADNWNGGGLHFSNDYGFGSVDAYNAVRMAEVWSLFAGPKASANETSYAQNLVEPIVLGDGATTDIKFTFSGDPLTVDFVNVTITLSHALLYEVEIYLISPDGTTTELIDFGKQWWDDVKSGWVASFGANAFRGEDGIGEWTIRIVDEAAFDVGTLEAAKITLHGTDGGQAANDLTADVYHYTSEVFTSLDRDAGRLELSDADGGSDWIDAAAMASNLVIRLASGETSTAGGVAFVQIANGTDIENAVTGDGNDELHGSDLDNKLYGMRGNDKLFGGLGNDTLSGGAGNDMLTGGVGLDNFLFDRALNAATNVDVITDFSHADDTIWLDGAVFSSLSMLVADGLWVSSVFYGGADISGHDAYLLYDFSAGALYYDADGLASTDDAILFATFASGSIPLDLSFDDLVVVSSLPGAMGFAEDRPDGFDPVDVDITPLPNAGIGGLIIGTEFEDTILTKDTEDRIFAKGGNDYISTGRGDDFVDGGEGLDRIFGGDGNDTLIGGGSSSYDGTYFPFEDVGEYIDGGAGNDVIEGSDQTNDFTYFLTGGPDDQLIGGLGDDVVWGKNGDDHLVGDLWFDDSGLDVSVGGNDILYGGAGSDTIWGGFGDDRIYAGVGRQNTVFGDVQRGLSEGEVGGIDTVVFEGNYDDYVMTGWRASYNQFVQISRVTPGEQENTLLNWEDIEYLEFKDRTLDLRERSLFYFEAFSITDADRDVVFNADGFEIVASLTNADDVTITDSGAENGDRDRLHTVILQNLTGNVEINSDAVGFVRMSALFDGPNPLNLPDFDGSVTVNAAAGERTLNLDLYAVHLNAGERISDDTATELILSADGKELWSTHANGAAADDHNMSFASASSIIVKQNLGNLTIKWYVPSAETIDMEVEWPEIVGFDDDMNGGNAGVITIETALDDKLFATAGGSDAYEFIGGGGAEYIRFGNLGSVNAGNDGTVSGMQEANEGLGLRGSITGVNEAWILGTDAFQVNSTTGQKGTVSAGNFAANGTDVVRMTFAVAAAIEDISDYISGFEYVQFDITSEGRTVDTDKFDDLKQVIVRGYSGVASENTVELLDGSTVVIKSVGTDDNFGILHLNGISAGLTLSFVDLWKDTEPFLVSAGVVQEQSLAEGTIHVRDAEIVNIKTDSRSDLFAATTLFDRSAPTLDSFGQALDLEAATTVTITGDTGWDFTVAGTDISHVVSLDASGVTGTGVVGGVTAFAQTSDAVNFKGGKGNDIFAGGADNDTLDGGAGFDTVKLSGERADYLFEFVGGALRVTDTRGGAPDGVDTLRNVERITFNDGTSIGTGPDFTGQPADILTSSDAVDENSANGTIVATLSALDPDSTDTDFTYTIRYDRWGAFKIEDDKLVVAESFAFDYEGLKASGVEGRISVTVRATDSSGKFVDKELSFWVGDVVGEHVIGDDVRNVIWGGAGDDHFEGRGGDDYLDGGIGNNVLIGGAGNDTLRAGIGDSTAVYSGNRADYAVVKDGQYFRYGSFNVIDSVAGRDGLDTLTGIKYLQFADGTFLASDILTDPVENGTPSVVLENLLPTLKENASTAQPIKIADIVVTDDGIGTNRLSVTGRDAAMFQIIGMALFLKAGVLLDAATAAELEFAVAVDDDDLAGSPDAVSNTCTLDVEDVAGYGVIRGTAASERINGTSGDDVIIGNGGDDDMRGGKGNDTYVVDSVGDKATEASGGGLDTVLSSVSYKLGSHVENLTLTGGGDIDGTGNSKNNVITGNDGNNILRGGDGNDTIYGGGGTDTIYGDAGNDKLYGGSGADKLYGGSGDDILDGGANADEMWGNSGNDVYYVDDVGDVVTESSSQGTDTIYASVNYTLGSSQERLYLAGSDEVSATGNTKDNRIGGNEAANLLTGGAGKDAFVFNTALGNGNVDTIADFNVKDDTIWLDNAFFVGVGKDGNLSSGAFFAGTAAHDASDRIIYDKDTGALYFDADGSGAGEQIQFAELDADLALTYKDFYVI